MWCLCSVQGKISQLRDSYVINYLYGAGVKLEVSYNRKEISVRAHDARTRKRNTE